MRKLPRATCWVAVTWALLLATPSSGRSAVPNDASRIAEVRDTWARAINTRDVHLLLGVYAAGAVLFPADAPPQLGAVAIAGWHGRWSSSVDVHYAVEADAVRIHGDRALEEWTALVTVTPRGDDGIAISGDPLQFLQHGVRVYRKDRSGHWRIDRETWSPDHPTVAGFASGPARPCGRRLC